jgi:hypothetical protein
MTFSNNVVVVILKRWGKKAENLMGKEFLPFAFYHPEQKMW